MADAVTEAQRLRAHSLRAQILVNMILFNLILVNFMPAAAVGPMWRADRGQSGFSGGQLAGTLQCAVVLLGRGPRSIGECQGGVEASGG